MFQESELDPRSTLEHQARSNNLSQHDPLYGGVSLSISLKLKLAPVPYATPKWQNKSLSSTFRRVNCACFCHVLYSVVSANMLLSMY